MRPIRLWERGKDIKEGQLFRAKEISVEGHRGIELVPVEKVSNLTNPLRSKAASMICKKCGRNIFLLPEDKKCYHCGEQM